MTAFAANILLLETVAKALKELKDKIVFVGGATVALYLDDPGSSGVRPTIDVDCVIEIASRLEYSKLEIKLRGLGFVNSMDENAPICRWKYGNIIVDIMPTDEHILGFTNKWYRDGIKNAIVKILPSKTPIKIFTAPYFLVTKLEAFSDRGQGDFMASSDLEDIVTVLDGHGNITEEVAASSKAVKTYIIKKFKELLNTNDFVQNLIGHLPPDPASKVRARNILEMMQRLST